MKKCPHWEDEPQSGRDSFYYYPDGTEAGFLCDQCAVDEGFCPGCGYFVLGSEWDDSSLGRHGICMECLDELRIEMGEYDDTHYDEIGGSW